MKQPSWKLQSIVQLGDDDLKNIEMLRQAIILADQHYNIDSSVYLTRFIGQYADVEAAKLHHLLLNNPVRRYLMGVLMQLLERNPPKIVINVSPEKIAQTKEMLERVKIREWAKITFNDPVDAITANFM